MPIDAGDFQWKFQVKWDVFVKHECPHNSHFFQNDLDLGTKEKVLP